VVYGLDPGRAKWWVGSDYLFGTAKDLREKYQERYAFLPGKKVPGSSAIPL
jgi:hypothetical protein